MKPTQYLYNACFDHRLIICQGPSLLIHDTSDVKLFMWYLINSVNVCFVFLQKYTVCKTTPIPSYYSFFQIWKSELQHLLKWRCLIASYHPLTSVLTSLLTCMCADLSFCSIKQQADSDKTKNKHGEDSLTIDEFMQFYRIITSREELEDLFERYACEISITPMCRILGK